MQVLLDGLLPRLFPSLSYLCVPHEGKTDIERSIPRGCGSFASAVQRGPGGAASGMARAT